MFGNCNDLVIIFKSTLPHGLVFQSRKLCFSEILGYCILFLVGVAIIENTEISLIVDHVVVLLKENQAPGFARLGFLPTLSSFAFDSKTRESSLETLRKHRSLTEGTHDFYKVWTEPSGSNVCFSSNG